MVMVSSIILIGRSIDLYTIPKCILEGEGTFRRE